MKIDLELTTVCNLDCVFCQRYDHKPPRKEITFYHLENLPYKLIKHITVCGSYGDPFIYSCINEFIDILIKEAKHCKIVFHTNGTIKNRLFWRELGRKFKNLDFWVQFGIDGIDSITYNKYRLGGDFFKARQNMIEYSKSGKTIWQYIIFKHNEDDLEDAENIATELKIKFNAIMSYKYDEHLQRPTKYDNILVEKNNYCQSIKENMISIDFDGNVTPCCHTRPAKQANFDHTELTLLKLNKGRLTEESDFFKYFRQNYKNIKLCQRTCGVKKRYELRKN